MSQEKRRFERFLACKNLRYKMIYDLDTKVRYNSMSEALINDQVTSHLAQSQDVSLEGLSFISANLLTCGDLINMDVFIPTSEESVHMEGEVRWSFRISDSEGEEEKYKAGIKILTVKGESVEASIHFDEKYKLDWSNVLEVILGEYSKLSQKRHSNEG